tara:strand:- start:212 stop:490 length:279 start_codon:yes stop_codon:yes gene_type:complete
MPTYNYYCKNCDAHFSYFQRMSDLPISNCEKCNGQVKRVITGGTGLIFKGSGFYLTDYKNNKSKKNNISKKKNKEQNKSIESKAKIKKEKNI